MQFWISVFILLGALLLTMARAVFAFECSEKLLQQSETLILVKGITLGLSFEGEVKVWQSLMVSNEIISWRNDAFLHQGGISQQSCLRFLHDDHQKLPNTLSRWMLCQGRARYRTWPAIWITLEVYPQDSALWTVLLDVSSGHGGRVVIKSSKLHFETTLRNYSSYSEVFIPD